MAKISDTAGLEAFMVGPYRWNAVTYSGFLQDAYDKVIKPEVERLQNIEGKKRKQVEQAKTGNRENEAFTNDQTFTNGNQSYDLELAQLVKRLIDESNKVLGEEKWTDIIGTKVWNILKLDEYGNDRYKLDSDKDGSAALKKKSVVQLLKFIRNKFSHIRTCKDEVKKKLSQFFDKGDNCQFNFNENKFVAFWLSKFPKLVPYLWLKFFQFKDKLVNYYPDYEIDIERIEIFLLNLNTFVKELQISLTADLEKGNVIKRFKGLACSLEFREFRGKLDKTTFVKISAHCNGKLFLSVSYLDPNVNKLEYVGTATGNEDLIIILSDNIDNDKVWKYCKSCDCRVIIFCDQDKLTEKKIAEAAMKFKCANNFTLDLIESPISGTELSKEKQDWVYETGHVSIQNRDFKIKDVFSDYVYITGKLFGEILRKLLKKETAILCVQYKYPEYKGVYIERKLYFTDAHGSGKIEYYNEKEFFQRVGANSTKAVYLFAQSGMGKSKVLISLEKRVENGLVIYSSFRNFTDILLKRVRFRKCCKTDISSAILEVLQFKNECERLIISEWLEQKSSSGARVYLQLDGLDQVPSGNLELALEAVKIIKNDFAIISLFITSSKSVSCTTMELNMTCCSIAPFSYHDKMSFFKWSWNGKYPELTEDQLENHIDQLLLRLSLCPDLKMLNHFTDFPLSCSMLAELYEDKLTKLIEPEEGMGLELVLSSMDLYEALTNEKFVILHKETYGIELDESDNNFRLLRENYFQLHMHLALVYLFPEFSHEFPEPLSVEMLDEANYHKMGIITNQKPLTFIHLTYADFLVARYVVKVLKTERLGNLCSKDAFYNIMKYGTPDQTSEAIRYSIWVFVDECLGKDTELGDLEFVKALKGIQKGFQKTGMHIGRFLSGTIEFGMWELAKLLINLWVDKTNLIKCSKILNMALISNAPSNWLESMYNKFSHNIEEMFLVYSVQDGNYQIAKYIMENWQKYDVFDVFEYISGGVFHCILDGIRDEIRLTDPNDFVEETKLFIKYVHGKNGYEIKRVNRRGEDFLVALSQAEPYRYSGITSDHIASLQKFLIEELGATSLD